MENLTENKPSDPDVNFVFFGCWNNGVCVVNQNNENTHAVKNGVTGTMETLKKFIEEKDEVNQIIIAGDNYYPDKPSKTNKTIKTDKKQKTINIPDLTSGFNCLNDAIINKNIEVNILLGNHDVDVGNDYDVIYNSNTENERKEENQKTNNNCLILETQNELIKNNENIKPFRFDVEKTYSIKGDTIIIYLDSSIYDVKTEGECYVGTFEEKEERNEEETIINFLKKKQIKNSKEIVNIINKDENKIQNVIFTAHHPFFGIKIKSDKLKIDFMEDFFHLIYNNYLIPINEKNKLCNFFHLCADIHNYQKYKINIDGIKIKQFIVGTGGADKDFFEINEIPNTTENVFFPINYKVKIESNNKTIVEIENKDKNEKKTNVEIESKNKTNVEIESKNKTNVEIESKNKTNVEIESKNVIININCVVKEVKNKNGFLHVYYGKNNKLKFEFISAEPPTIKGGKKTKKNTPFYGRRGRKTNRKYKRRRTLQKHRFLFSKK